jgi:hypothetical protein
MGLNFAWRPKVKQERHCVADLPLYEYLRQRLTERSLPLGLIPLWALLAGASDFLRLSADEYIHDSDQKLADRETVGQSYVEIVGGVTGKNNTMTNMCDLYLLLYIPTRAGLRVD